MRNPSITFLTDFSCEVFAYPIYITAETDCVQNVPVKQKKPKKRKRQRKLPKKFEL